MSVLVVAARLYRDAARWARAAGVNLDRDAVYVSAVWDLGRVAGYRGGRYVLVAGRDDDPGWRAEMARALQARGMEEEAVVEPDEQDGEQQAEDLPEPEGKQWPPTLETKP